MIQHEKEHGFIKSIKEGFSYTSQIISAYIFPQISDGAQLLMKNIDQRVSLIEKRMLRKITSLTVILFGGVFLVFSIFYFLIEFMNWNYTAAFFAIGITVFVIGLILKVIGYDK